MKPSATLDVTLDRAMFRAAAIDDCYTIAQLFSIASDGVADYIWSTLTADYPGLTLLEIGAQRYTHEESLFSYKNCVLAERKGKFLGMMLTFPIAETQKSTEPEIPLIAETTTSQEADVLAPYALEAPNTWYICALAVFPEFRGQGIGTQLLAIAHQQAAERNIQQLSLLCFEQNTGALKLYQRNGFKEIDRAKVVPHPLIHHTGDILLMTTPVRV
jgi:ribosomal protein S18 acetylase RimI-like enzyme